MHISYRQADGQADTVIDIVGGMLPKAFRPETEENTETGLPLRRLPSTES